MDAEEERLFLLRNETKIRPTKVMMKKEGKKGEKVIEAYYAIKIAAIRQTSYEPRQERNDHPIRVATIPTLPGTC